MIAYLVLLAAVLSRCVPHWMHSPSLGFTAIGAGLLFFGSRLKSGKARWQALMAPAIMAATDYYLTVYVYGFSFKPGAYLVTWAWGAGIVLFGAALLSRKRSFLRVTGAALFSATSFFILNNGALWLDGGMYPRTAGGLATCYTMALPFYGNDLVATLLISGVLFGLPALVREMHSLLEGPANGGSRPA
jgi:hypothetical protein